MEETISLNFIEHKHLNSGFSKANIIKKIQDAIQFALKTRRGWWDLFNANIPNTERVTNQLTSECCCQYCLENTGWVSMVNIHCFRKYILSKESRFFSILHNFQRCLCVMNISFLHQNKKFIYNYHNLIYLW